MGANFHYSSAELCSGLIFKYLPCEWTSDFSGGEEDEFWKSCINKLHLASGMLLCFPCLLKVPVKRSLDDTEISQNIGWVRRNWEPKQGRTFSFWSTILPVFVFSAFFMMYWQRNVRISFLKTKEWMNKVFFSLIPETSYGPFFFPKPVRLGFKKQNPNNTVKPKRWSRCCPLVKTSIGLVSFSKCSWKPGFKEEDQNETIEHKLTKLALGPKIAYLCVALYEKQVINLAELLWARLSPHTKPSLSVPSLFAR